MDIEVKFLTGNILDISRDSIKDETVFPVFHEELEIIGLDKFFKFPKAKEPICWALDKKGYLLYLYEGKVIAKIKKPSGATGNIKYLFIDKNVKELQPINLQEFSQLNQEYIIKIQEEAKEYISKEFKRFSKSSPVIVSYSGGKDSQVVLDLVFQVIPAEKFHVIFTDTTMELSPTLKMVEETEKFYKQKYHEFKIYKATGPQKASELWKAFGPPSRMLRWCCSVYKIAPQIRLLESLYEKGIKQILTYEGTRADESQRRQKYNKTSPRQKTFKEINVRPIFGWNNIEVFSYILFHSLPLNPLYRLGLRRVGCSVCPFASPWSEFIIYKHFPDEVEPFTSVILNYAENLGIKSEEKKREYLFSGKWKERSGGLGLKSDIKVETIEEKGSFKAVVENPRENILEWIKVLGSVIYRKSGSSDFKGEITVANRSYIFSIKKNKKGFTFTMPVAPAGAKTLRRIKGVINKAAFCLHCTGCEVECPNNALKTYPEVTIDETSCTSCGRCIDFINSGCYSAKSYRMEKGGMSYNKKSKKTGLDRYSTFGLKKEWIDSFFSMKGDFWERNLLGPKQIPAFKNFLKDSELIEKKNKSTELLEILIKLNSKFPELPWQIIWINLTTNSELFRWYLEEISWGQTFTKKELIEKLSIKYDLKDRTAKNAVNSLIRTFNESPLGEWFGKKEGKTTFIKKGLYNPNRYAVAYALYKFAEKEGFNSITITDLYSPEISGGPYFWFGTPRRELEKILRGLKDLKLIDLELVADLDNIHIHRELSSLDILKKLSEK